MFGKYFKKYERWSIVISILMLILAIFLIVKPLESLSTFIIVFGFILIVNGVACLIDYFIAKPELRMMSFALVEGILSILAGIVVIATSEKLTAFLPVILAIWIIIKSLINFQYAVNLSSIPGSGWGWILVLSIITFIFGLVIIFHPFTSAIITTATVGVFLAIAETVNIIESVITLVKVKNV